MLAGGASREASLIFRYWLSCEPSLRRVAWHCLQGQTGKYFFVAQSGTYALKLAAKPATQPGEEKHPEQTVCYHSEDSPRTDGSELVVWRLGAAHTGRLQDQVSSVIFCSVAHTGCAIAEMLQCR